MGITLSQQIHLDLNKLSTINTAKFWGEYTTQSVMNEPEFQKFLSDLCQQLSLPLTQAQISNTFNKLHKKGEISFDSFENEFINWCNEKVRDELGTEVLQPVTPQHSINREYEISIETNAEVYKKFWLSNPDNFDKELIVKSDSEAVIKVRTQKIFARKNQGDYIRLKFVAPTLEGNFMCNLILQHASSLQIEEVLRFNINFTRKEPKNLNSASNGSVKPPIGTSGSIKKTNSWSFLGRSPSPSRNSDS